MKDQAGSSLDFARRRAGETGKEARLPKITEAEKISKEPECIPCPDGLKDLEKFAAKIVKAFGEELAISAPDMRWIMQMLNLKVVLSRQVAYSTGRMVCRRARWFIVYDIIRMDDRQYAFQLPAAC